jgi:hypothetical protein
MSMTRTNTDPSVQLIETAAEGSIAVKTNRHTIWPVLMVAMGLLTSLAWSGLLGWVVYRMIAVL